MRALNRAEIYGKRRKNYFKLKHIKRKEIKRRKKNIP